MKRSAVIHGGIAIALLPALCSAALGSSQDDFEAYALGAFPPAPWLDAGQVAPLPSTPDPSATVVATTDAFAFPTQAVSVAGAVTASQGLYQLIPVSGRYTAQADVLVDQFSSPSSAPTFDWAIAVGVAEMDGGNPASVPQVVVFASSFDKNWHVFAFDGNSSAVDVDLEERALSDRWYRVSMELDVGAGQVRSRIWDVAMNQLLVDRTDTVQSALPASPAFDAVLIYEGELSDPVFVPNLSLVDNVLFQHIFVDGFESGDVSSWSASVP